MNDERNTLSEVHKPLRDRGLGPFSRKNGLPEFLGDVIAKHGASISIRRDGRFAWINVDDVCVLRILVPDHAPVIEIDNRANNPQPETNGG